ncbi:MAG: efflux RND transporter periplasmic adaptor subunit [Sulfurimonas sp.]|nr:efflux RND transporter periplasmic adaptor subunit [Sulfurimonas sp.]PHQ91404.1 MAG: cation transporter [Sulfurimonas sp.]
MKYLLFSLVLAFTSIDAKIKTVEQLFNVQTVKVKKSSYAKTLKSYGFVKVDSSKVYDVAPRFGGFVEKLYANKLYEKVVRGQALARVYSPEVLKAKDGYVNSLRYAKNKTMIESSRAKLKLLNIPSNEIKSMKKKRTLTTIVSPIHGYIFKKNINNNSAFNAKDVLFEIVNLDNVWVEVNIHQDQLARLSTLDTFILSTPALSQTFVAKSSGVYPHLDLKEESFTLRLEVANPQTLLKPGMYMNVIMSQEKENYLTLPTTAVIRKNGNYYAFVVGEYEGEYEPLEIRVEVLNPSTYIIKSGLSEGDSVVNNALFMMDSDAQINGLY